MFRRTHSNMKTCDTWEDCTTKCRKRILLWIEQIEFAGAGVRMMTDGVQHGGWWLTPGQPGLIQISTTLALLWSQGICLPQGMPCSLQGTESYSPFCAYNISLLEIDVSESVFKIRAMRLSFTKILLILLLKKMEGNIPPRKPYPGSLWLSYTIDLHSYINKEDLMCLSHLPWLLMIWMC